MARRICGQSLRWWLCGANDGSKRESDPVSKRTTCNVKFPPTTTTQGQGIKKKKNLIQPPVTLSLQHTASGSRHRTLSPPLRLFPSHRRSFPFSSLGSSLLSASANFTPGHFQWTLARSRQRFSISDPSPDTTCHCAWHVFVPQPDRSYTWLRGAQQANPQDRPSKRLKRGRGATTSPSGDSPST